MWSQLTSSHWVAQLSQVLFPWWLIYIWNASSSWIPRWVAFRVLLTFPFKANWLSYMVCGSARKGFIFMDNKVSCLWELLSSHVKIDWFLCMVDSSFMPRTSSMVDSSFMQRASSMVNCSTMERIMKSWKYLALKFIVLNKEVCTRTGKDLLGEVMCLAYR